MYYQKAVMSFVLGIVVAAGCSRGPKRVLPPSINAAAAGSEAIAMYDADNDGKISGTELDKCPALKTAMSRTDKDGDKALTADEIAKRIEAWLVLKIGRVPITCTVLSNGRPLPDAEVRFVPEKFLGENMTTAQGKTSKAGMVLISIEMTDSSDSPGVPPGLYRVEITKNGEDIPAKYNTETILGQEVALDAPGIREGIKFNLAY